MASSRRLPASYNVSTYGTDSRDYSALATWEAATDNDLVTATKGEVLECYDDEASFDDSVAISGATTNSSYFRVIKPAAGEGHDGTPNNGVFFLCTTGPNVMINSAENYFGCYDLIGRLETSISGNSNCFASYLCDYNKFVGLIVNGGVNTAGNANGIFGSTNQYTINCLVLDIPSWAYYDYVSSNCYWYNCTSVGNSTGFYSQSGTAIAKNCISCDCTADFSGTWTKTTCYEGDATAFKDQANDDYHLAAADTTAKGNGTDLSADGTYAFDDDIDGTIRAAWDIGFDEYGATGWAGKVLGVTGIAKINGIAVADIAKVMGV